MTLHLTNPTRRLIVTLLAVFSIVVTALPTAFLTPAEAATTAGFEIDGNYTGTADWAGVPSASLTTITEPVPDVIYGDGNPDGKESGYPNGWRFQQATATPGKNDLTVGYLHTRIHNGRQWLMIAVERAEATGGGDTDVLVEFNQTDWTGSGTAITPGGRTEGDLLVQFDLKGQNAVNPTLVASRWSGTAWTPVGVTYDSAINAGQITNLRNQTIAPGTFGEVALDLTAVYAGRANPCVTFGSMFARTQTSGGGQDPQLTDILGPENGLILSTCGTITVKKEDAEGRGLQGATFALYENDGDDVFEPGGDDGPAVDTCDTGTAGTCGFTDVEPAPTEYWIEETVAPTGYALSPDTVYGPFSISIRQDFVVPAGTFQNPRIPYAIDVRTDATNLLGDEHVFVVTLTKGATASEQPDSGSQQLSIPVSGATVNLTWVRGSGSDSSITHVEDANGGPTATGDVLSANCVTRGDSGGAADEGTCLVTVNSATAGSGTLTGSYTITSYQHVTGAATNPTWWTNSARSVSDTATKTWVDYSATVGDTATNLVGDEHLFTIDVDGPAGADLGDPAAKVGFWWDGAGSVTEINGVAAGTPISTDTTLGGLYECDVVPGVPASNGTCTVEVDSSAVGSGTLTIAYIHVGDIDGDGDEDLIDYDVDGAGTDDPSGRAVTAEQSASKTWVTFSASVDDDSTNLVDDSHDFVLTMAGPDGIDLAGAKIGFYWDGTGGVDSGAVLIAAGTAFGDLYECSVGDEDTCTVTVSSSDIGEGTLTIAYLDVTGKVEGALTVIDLDVDGDGGIDETGAPVGDEQTATKRWVDYEAVVETDGENLVSDPVHTFTITASGYDGAGTPDVEPAEGVTVGFTWTGDGSVLSGATHVVDDLYECVTSAAVGSEGTCSVSVTSTATGTGTLTIAYVDATGFVDGELDTVFYGGEGRIVGDQQDADKVWVDYRLSVSPMTDENLTGSNHVFTVLVERDSGDGDGFQPLADANPSLEITDGPGDILAPANLCASTGTDANGECTVTITSSETGTTTVQARYLGTAADSEAGTFASDEATKKWVDYAIDVDPDRAVNPVGTTHTFTVTLQRIEDGVAAAAAGESIALAIIGPGDIIEVPDGTIATDARSGSCTTDTDGQCTVTIASDDVGDTTLTATYDAVVGESTGTFSDSGLKLWRSDPAIELIKEADIEPTAEGLKIISCNADGCPETTFTFTVTNVGGVALHDVTLTDDKFGAITLAKTELAVGESTTGTATYVPSRDEIDAGVHENLGTATGVSPDGQTVEDTDPEVVEILEVLPLPPIERPPAPAPEPLPRTGADVVWLTTEGLLALLIGWAMVWVGRRKAEGQES